MSVGPPNTAQPFSSGACMPSIGSRRPEGSTNHLDTGLRSGSGPAIGSGDFQVNTRRPYTDRQSGLSAYAPSIESVRPQLNTDFSITRHEHGSHTYVPSIESGRSQARRNHPITRHQYGSGESIPSVGSSRPQVNIQSFDTGHPFGVDGSIPYIASLCESNQSQVKTGPSDTGHSSSPGGLNPEAESFTPSRKNEEMKRRQACAVHRTSLSPPSQNPARKHAASEPQTKRVSFTIPGNPAPEEVKVQNLELTGAYLRFLLSQQQELLNKGCDIEAKMRKVDRWSTKQKGPKAATCFSEQLTAVREEFRQYQEKSRVLAFAAEREREKFSGP